MTDRDRLIELMERKYFCSLIELADYLIANGVTVNEWRLASELPKEEGEYNVIIDGFAITTTLYYSRAHSGWYEFNDDEYSIPYAVTHWMPLPQPPKEVE